jgi:hypothetical protein
MTTTSRSQIPLNRAIVDKNGYLTVPWSFWFQTQNNYLPPANSAGYVVNASVPTDVTTATATLAIGPAGNIPLATDTSLYFSTDTGQIFISNNTDWVLGLPEFFGDVTKPINSQTLTLSTVNGNVGTFGSGSTTPVITVDEKGRITNIFSVPNDVPVPRAGGSNGQVQFNNSGVLDGSNQFTYDTANDIATIFNVVSSNITTQQLTVGSGNTSTININSQIALGANYDAGLAGQVLTSTGPLSAPIWTTVTASGGMVPYYVEDFTTFTVPIYFQALFQMPIEIAPEGYIEVDGYLIEV